MGRRKGKDGPGVDVLVFRVKGFTGGENGRMHVQELHRD